MQVQIDSYSFPLIESYGNPAFIFNPPKLSKEQRIKLLSRILNKTYSVDYMTYLINTTLPTFLIKPEYIKE